MQTSPSPRTSPHALAWRAQAGVSVGTFRVIGNSPAFRHVLALVERVARSDAPVLIEGETGSGKEVAARLVHYGGPRAAEPFVPINCGALPDELFESELFGHERGAFTDARERRRGLVAEAEGGTLFLDEVDALAPKSQVALLRFLQDQCFRPLGSSREQQGNVRLIAASNRELEPLVSAGLMRQDLLYRLKVLHLALPPLRQRGRDAALLAQHFAERFARKYGHATRGFNDEVLAWIADQAWPGNIRELENWVHRRVLMAEASDGANRLDADVCDLGESFDPADPPPMTGSGPSTQARPMPSFRDAKAEAVARFERTYLRRALRHTGGNISQAAALAGKERRAFGKLLKKHAIDPDDC